MDELMREARDWIADCVWADYPDPEDLNELTDEQVRAGIERHYDGGLAGFAADGA